MAYKSLGHNSTPIRSVTFGRPPSFLTKADEVRKLAAQKISKSGIARRLNIGRTSVRRILKSAL